VNNNILYLFLSVIFTNSRILLSIKKKALFIDREYWTLLFIYSTILKIDFALTAMVVISAIYQPRDLASNKVIFRSVKITGISEPPKAVIITFSI